MTNTLLVRRSAPLPASLRIAKTVALAVLVVVAGLLTILLPALEPGGVLTDKADATVAGQRYCRSASTADYNGGYAYYKLSPGGVSYKMAQGQCVTVGNSAQAVADFRGVQVGCRFRVYNNDPDSSNYGHYGSWKSISGGRREAPLGGTTKQIVQVDATC